MITIDSHESIELGAALGQLVRVEWDNLNPERADLYWLGYGGIEIQWELKQAGEALGSLESVEEQLGREMQAGGYTGLAIRGIVTPDKDGFCQTWKAAHSNPHIIVGDRVFRHSYKGYRAWLGRLQELGVAVVEVPDLMALVVTMAALYENSQKPDVEHRTFQRLIPENVWVREPDVRKRDMAMSAMGIKHGGWGEELALAASAQYATIIELVDALRYDHEGVAKLRLRNGTRTIGKAKVAQMRRALGIDE